MKFYKYYFIISMFIVCNTSYAQSSNIGDINKGVLLNTKVSQSSAATTSTADFLSGYWGVRFNLNGGIRLDVIDVFKNSGNQMTPPFYLRRLALSET